MENNAIHIVTGAAGRVGFPLCEELIKRGLKVRAFDKAENALTQKLKELGCEVFLGDITNPKSIDNAFCEGAYVYHLAGIVSIESKPKQILYDVNVGGTQNIIDACFKHKVKKLIFVGSVDMLESAKVKGVISEPQRFAPDKVSKGYSLSKALAGNLVLDAAQKGLDAVIAMPSGVIGPYEYTQTNFGQAVAQISEGKLRIAIKGKHAFVDIRDVINELCNLAECGKSGESYIISGHIITVKDMMNIIAYVANVKKIRITIPLFIIKLIARSMERRALRKNIPPTLTPYSIRVLQENCNYSHKKLTALTGYVPRPIEESLSDHTAFYFEQKK